MVLGPPSGQFWPVSFILGEVQTPKPRKFKSEKVKMKSESEKGTWVASILKIKNPIRVPDQD